MRPLTVLLGIIMGSAVALASALTMTGIVFVLLHREYGGRLEDEIVPLLKGLAWSWTLTIVSAAAFTGELKSRPWRHWPQVALLSLVGALGWVYWPA